MIGCAKVDDTPATGSLTKLPHGVYAFVKHFLLQLTNRSTIRTDNLDTSIHQSLSFQPEIDKWTFTARHRLAGTDRSGNANEGGQPLLQKSNLVDFKFRHLILIHLLFMDKTIVNLTW